MDEHAGGAGTPNTEQPPLRVGVIGLGAIGEPVARLILAAGHAVTVHNRSTAAPERLAALGATIADSPAAVAAVSDIVLLALPHPAASEEVVLGERGVLAGAAGTDGLLLLDLSTVAPELSRRLHAACAARGVGFLDAPVSGGPEGAAAGTLTIMCGGEADDVARALPLLRLFGSRVEHVGPSGSGSALKLVNQLLVAIHSAAAAEAVAFAQAMGVDGGTAFGIIHDAWGSSRVLDRLAPLMLARDFSGGATVAIVGKDSDLIADAAAGVGLSLEVSAAARRLLQQGAAAGNGALDVASLLEQVEATRTRDVPAEAGTDTDSDMDTDAT